MGSIKDAIKKEANSKGLKIQDSKSAKLEKIINKTLLTDKEKNMDEQIKFVQQVLTRGQESSERIGLHASDLIKGDTGFCLRQQVLRLLYRQRQQEQHSIGTLKIFSQGDAMHEKWQRLFIRAGYSKAKHLDVTKEHEDYEITYTPDIICKIPEFSNRPLIIEIKSAMSFAYKSFLKAGRHKEAEKQLMWYMFLRGIHQGATLVENKDTQDIFVKYYEFDEEYVEPFIERAEEVQFYKDRVLEEGKMVCRKKTCTKPSDKKPDKCPMRDACFNVGIGRQRI